MNDYIFQIYAVIRDLMVPLLLTTAAIALGISPTLRRRLVKAFFLSVELEPPATEKDNSELVALKAEIESLKARVDQPLSKEAAQALKNRIDVQLYSHVPEIVQKHLDALGKKDDEIVRHFQKSAAESAYSYLKDIPFSELISNAIYREAWDSRKENVENFAKLIERQLATANATRMIMMNLFVFIKGHD